MKTTPLKGPQLLSTESPAKKPSATTAAFQKILADIRLAKETPKSKAQGPRLDLPVQDDPSQMDGPLARGVRRHASDRADPAGLANLPGAPVQDQPRLTPTRQDAPHEIRLPALAAVIPDRSTQSLALAADHTGRETKTKAEPQGITAHAGKPEAPADASAGLTGQPFTAVLARLADTGNPEAGARKLPTPPVAAEAPVHHGLPPLQPLRQPDDTHPRRIAPDQSVDPIRAALSATVAAQPEKASHGATEKHLDQTPAVPSVAEPGEPIALARTPEQVAAARVAGPVLDLQTPELLPEQLAGVLRQAARQDIAQLQLQVHPADLGPVDIQLRWSADQQLLAVDFNSPFPEVQDLLQQQLPDLRRTLDAQGIQLTEGSQFSQSRERRDAPAQPDTARQDLPENRQVADIPGIPVARTSTGRIDTFA